MSHYSCRTALCRIFRLMFLQCRTRIALHPLKCLKKALSHPFGAVSHLNFALYGSYDCVAVQGVSQLQCRESPYTAPQRQTHRQSFHGPVRLSWDWRFPGNCFCVHLSSQKRQHINTFDPNPFLGQSGEVVYVYWFLSPDLWLFASLNHCLIRSIRISIYAGAQKGRHTTETPTCSRSWNVLRHASGSRISLYTNVQRNCLDTRVLKMHQHQGSLRAFLGLPLLKQLTKV